MGDLGEDAFSLSSLSPSSPSSLSPLRAVIPHVEPSSRAAVVVVPRRPAVFSNRCPDRCKRIVTHTESFPLFGVGDSDVSVVVVDDAFEEPNEGGKGELRAASGTLLRVSPVSDRELQTRREHCSERRRRRRRRRWWWGRTR